MKKRIISVALVMMLVFGMTSCTNEEKNPSFESQQSTVEESDDTRDTQEETLDRDSIEAETDVDSADEMEEEIETIKPEEDETGNFEGLDVEEEINIDVNDGENTVGG